MGLPLACDQSSHWLGGDRCSQVCQSSAAAVVPTVAAGREALPEAGGCEARGRGADGSGVQRRQEERSLGWRSAGARFDGFCGGVSGRTVQRRRLPRSTGEAPPFDTVMMAIAVNAPRAIALLSQTPNGNAMLSTPRKTMASDGETFCNAKMTRLQIMRTAITRRGVCLPMGASLCQGYAPIVKLAGSSDTLTTFFDPLKQHFSSTKAR